MMAAVPSSSPAATDNPKFSSITADDHGGVVAIIAALLMTATLISLSIRIYIRISITKGVGVDDHAFTAASTLAIGQTIATLVSVDRGFGKKTNLIPDQTTQITQLEKAIYSSDILLILAVAVSKCSVCLLIKRLTRSKTHRVAANAVLATSLVWGFACTLAVGIHNPLASPWQLLDVDPSESKALLRWQVIGSLDIAIEVALGLLPVFLTWKLQMPFRPKFLVVLAFSFRLLVIPAIATRLAFLKPALDNAPDDIFFTLVTPALCTQVALHWGLMAATIPCLKPFMRAANTGYMGFGGTFVDRTQNTYALSSLKTTKLSSGNNNNDSSVVGDERQDASGNGENSNTAHGPGGGGRNMLPNLLDPSATTWTKINSSRHSRRMNQRRGRDESSSAAGYESDDTDGSNVGIIQRTTSWTVEYHENEDEGKESTSTK